MSRPTAVDRSLLALAFGLVLPACAQAQFDPTAISAVHALQQNGFLQNGTRPNPLQPQGFPNPDAKRPDEQVDEQAYRLIHAEDYETKGSRHIKLTGDVEFVARGYHVRCDEAEYDSVAEVATARGHVLITGNGSDVYGEEVTVDFANGTYIAKRTETQLSPDQLDYNLTDKLYVSGKLSSGTQLLNHTQDGTFTTCNYDKPHYDITGRDVEYRANKRIIFRDAKVVLFGKTILQLPFLVVPIDNRAQRYSPEVGYTDDEGYFIKNIVGIPMKGNATLYTHEDYMTKLGLGLGADYDFELPGRGGVASVYKIFGPGKTLTFSNNNHVSFRNGSATLQDDYQSDNYLTAPGQTLFNTRGAITYNNFLSYRAVDKLTLDRSYNSASSYTSVSETLGLNDTRTIGKLHTDTQLTYLSTSNDSSGSSTDAQRAQIKFTGTEDLQVATAQLQYQRAIPIGDTQGQFLGSSDLTPVVSLDSDSTRLFGKDFGRDVPLRTSLSWGEYADPRRESQVERTAFSLAYAKSSPAQDRFTIDTNASFRQSLYSDDTAQYTLGENENLRYKLGPDTGINLRYTYLRPYGYTPLSIDSTGLTNIVTTDINDRPFRPLLLGIQTGYDLNREMDHQIAWQQVGLRSEYTPFKNTLIRGLYTYNTTSQVFSTLRFDASTIQGDFRLNLNAQYDGVQHTWSSFNGSLDGLRIGRTKIAALFSYDGYTKKFETKQYAFTYDLHCAEAVLAVQENDTGFRPGRQIYFLLRIKALPFDLPFGTGTRGQGVGLGNGTSF